MKLQHNNKGFSFINTEGLLPRAELVSVTFTRVRRCCQIQFTKKFIIKSGAVISTRYFFGDIFLNIVHQMITEDWTKLSVIFGSYTELQPTRVRIRLSEKDRNVTSAICPIFLL